MTNSWSTYSNWTKSPVIKSITYNCIERTQNKIISLEIRSSIVIWINPYENQWGYQWTWVCRTTSYSTAECTTAAKEHNNFDVQIQSAMCIRDKYLKDFEMGTWYVQSTMGLWTLQKFSQSLPGDLTHAFKIQDDCILSSSLHYEAFTPPQVCSNHGFWIAWKSWVMIR